MEGEEGGGEVAGDLEGEGWGEAPAGGCGEVVPTGGEGAGAVEFVEVLTGGDGEGGGWEVAEDVELELGGEDFGVVLIRDGEGGGFHGGDIIEVGFAVGEVGFVVDDFDDALALAEGDEEEAIRGVAGGDGAGGLNGAVGGVAVPSVYVVHGVVGHAEEVA